MAISIRMTSYAGDFDEEREINVVGPYEDVDTRNAAIKHLESLATEAGAGRLYEFAPSELGTEGVDSHATPEAVAAASNFDEAREAFSR